MTPDLLEEGARRVEVRAKKEEEQGKTESGGRSAGFSRIAREGEVDIAHGRILYLEDVSVSFDGFKAINKLSLDIAPGELRCIIGPNGAGKTTMMDIITGKTRPDEGRVYFGSTIDLLRYKEPEIAQLGIVEAVGRFLAVARDEGHGRACVEKLHGRSHLTLGDAKLFRDAQIDRFHGTCPARR